MRTLRWHQVLLGAILVTALAELNFSRQFRLTGFQDRIASVASEPTMVYQHKGRMNYQLYINKSLSSSELTEYRCGVANDDPFAQNRTVLHDTPGLFNFETYIQTDLNIVIIGDSVAMQLAARLQAAASAPDFTVLWHLKWSTKAYGMTVSTPVAGGGAIAAWRMTGMMLRGQENISPPNRGKGFSRNHAKLLTNYTVHHQTSRNATRKSPSNYDAYDVLIFRISFPWVRGSEVTNETLKEMVQVASYWLGVEVVIIVPPYFVNNVMTEEDLLELRGMIARVRAFVADFAVISGCPIKHVLLADWAPFIDELITLNANRIGYDTHNSTDYLFEKLKDHPLHAPSIAQVCAERVLPKSKSCQRNLLFYDGMHLCFETLGSRINANLACLIRCAYDEGAGNLTKVQLQECARGCNDKFLSVRTLLDENEFLKTF